MGGTFQESAQANLPPKLSFTFTLAAKGASRVTALCADNLQLS